MTKHVAPTPLDLALRAVFRWDCASTVTDLAKASGLNPVTLRWVKTGRRHASRKTLRAVIRGLLRWEALCRRGRERLINALKESRRGHSRLRVVPGGARPRA